MCIIAVGAAVAATLAPRLVVLEVATTTAAFATAAPPQGAVGTAAPTPDQGFRYEQPLIGTLYPALSAAAFQPFPGFVAVAPEGKAVGVETGRVTGTPVAVYVGRLATLAIPWSETGGHWAYCAVAPAAS